MKYFLMIIDYSIAILLIISRPWWRMIANGKIDSISGFRTNKSMKSDENWKRANLFAGDYSFKFGILLLVFVFLMRLFSPLPMEWNTLIISIVGLVVLFSIIFFVNKKLK